LKDYIAIHFPEAEWIELAKMN
ncbi:hypothetical protein ACN6QX_09535, partial [Acinetobacter baumannii]